MLAARIVCTICRSPLVERRYWTTTVCSMTCWLADLAQRDAGSRPDRDRYTYTVRHVRHCLEYWLMLQAGRLPPLNADADKLPIMARSHPAFGPRPPGGAVTELRADLDSAIARLPEDLRAVVLAYAEQQHLARAALVVHRRRQDVRDDFDEAIQYLAELLNGDR